MKTRTLKLFATVLFIQLLLGCTTMFDRDTLRFKEHNFVVTNFSVSNVEWRYLKYWRKTGKEEWDTHLKDKLMRAKTERDANSARGTLIAIQGTGGVATIRWNSKNGDQHEHSVDFKQIFNDGVVLHKEDVSRIWKPYPFTGNPDIILEVDDRTLSVYMGTDIVLVPPSGDESKRNSAHKTELAYRKVF
jgi:hypothetical protein